MRTVEWVFHFRWILWGIALLGIAALFTARKKDFYKRIETLAENYFPSALFTLCFSFFGLGIIAKYSQLRSLSLNSEDFWLFEDMLNQMLRHGFMITRFAPQDLGWVQHGAVHGLLYWTIALPLGWIFGSTHASLIFGPFVLALGGVFFALLIRRSWGSFNALVFAFAFLASSQVGKILMYDVHPEAAYPLAVFLWLWSVGWDGGKVRWLPLLFSTVLGIGIKSDSIFVFFPWMIGSIFVLKGPARRAAVSSFLLAVPIYGLQIFSVAQWTSGKWGPFIWDGAPVIIPQGPGALKGAHWDSLTNAAQAVGKVIAAKGGWGAALEGLGRFLVSRSWLSILLLAPWIVIHGATWWLLLPLACVYSLLEQAAPLWNYYSAPLLGTVWALASLTPKVRSQKTAAWTLAASLLLGGGGIEFHFPSKEAATLQKEAQQALPCLEQIQGLGMVPSYLLGVVPHRKVWTDRIPRTPEQWKNVHFVLFTPDLSRFEIPQHDAQKLITQLSLNSEWKNLNSRCLSPDSLLQLWVKSPS